MASTQYKQQYLAIKYDYDTQCSMSTEVLDGYISSLDTKIKAFEVGNPDSRPSFCFNSSGTILGRPSSDGNTQIYSQDECNSMPNSSRHGNGECTKTTGGSYSWDCRPAAATGGSNTDAAERELLSSFAPISQYYANLQAIKRRLNHFLDKTSDQVVEVQTTLINKERYESRAHPNHEMKPRELVYGLFSELRSSSVPVLLAGGVFMACISILMIFQMFGFTGQINIPPALAAMPGQVSGAAGSEPIYNNPFILSGISIVLGVGVIVLGIMYYNARSNK